MNSDAVASGGSARFLVTGVSGSGKSSIALGLSECVPGLTIYEYGKCMAMAGRRLGLVDSYKDLPKLKLADRVRLQEEVASEVAESSGPVVNVAHVVVRAPEGYVDGLPPTVLDKLRLTGMLVVTSTSEQVRARRKGPMIESAGVISSHQDRVRIASTKIAEELAIPAAFILNLYGAFDGALERAFLFWEMFDSGARIGLRSMERL